MDSRQNISKSETSSFEVIVSEKPTGYSLKKQKFFKWLNAGNYSRKYVAKRLNITDEELMKRLNEHGLFDRAQLAWLINEMGAKTAIEVIYFPTPEQKKQVEYDVFGKYKEEKKNE